MLIKPWIWLNDKNLTEKDYRIYILEEYTFLKKGL